jgi:site-specific recombinase XerD
MNQQSISRSSDQRSGFGPHNMDKARRHYQQQRLQIMADRRAILVQLIEAGGAMGVVEIIARLDHDHGIVIKENTAKGDFDALVGAGRLAPINHKWDLPSRIPPPQPALGNAEVQAAIETYLAEKQSEGRAAGTLYEYRLYLQAFNARCNKPLAALTNNDVVSWINEERAKEYRDATILARWRALKIFFRWCVERELLQKTPVKMRSPKVKRDLPRVASYDGVQALLAYPLASWVDARNRALIHLMLDTGMRVGEALSLRWAHVDLQRQLVFIPPGKDAEGRVAPFTAGCGATLRAYLDVQPASGADWVFVGSYNGGYGPPLVAGQLTPVGVRKMLERLCKAAGVAYINPHSIRHLFATRALNAGMRVEVVSKILGHSKVDLTLRVYAALMTETLQKEYAAVWGA